MPKKKNHKFDYDCAVIGGGPGGLVSTLYLSRFKRKVLLVDSGHSRAQWIPRIRNLIGYGSGLKGLTLLRKLTQQVQLYSSDLVQGEAQVYRLKDGFKLKVGHAQYTARFVILATGMKDVQPPLENIPELRRKGVLAYCPICDGYDWSEQKIGIIVANSKGLKKAKFLHRFSPSITAFQVRPFELTTFDQSLIRENKVQIHQGELESLKYCQRPKGLWVQMKNQAPVFVHVAYVALGVDFNIKTTRHLKGLKRNKEGFILTKSHQETSIPGLYAVGDCVNALAQVSVAIGQAALAATRIHNRLN